MPFVPYSETGASHYRVLCSQLSQTHAFWPPYYTRAHIVVCNKLGRVVQALANLSHYVEIPFQEHFTGITDQESEIHLSS